MSVVVERELVDPDNPLSFCSLIPSFGVTPPPRAPLFRRSTVFCLLARPFGACRPLPAEGPPNVFCPGRPRGGQRQPLLILSSARTTTTVQLMNRSDGHRSAVDSDRPFGVPTGFSAL